jgi:methylglyoxal synthase
MPATPRGRCRGDGAQGDGAGRSGLALLGDSARAEELATFVGLHAGMLRGTRILASEEVAAAAGPFLRSVLTADRSDIERAAARGDLAAVLMLVSPGSDARALDGILSVCEAGGVPVAPTLATADVLLHHLARTPARPRVVARRHLRLVPSPATAPSA